MKAIVFTKYGSPDVLQLKEVERPIAGDSEVLIKIHAASIAFSDNAMVKGKPAISRIWSGLLKPRNKIPGSDMAGTVVIAGKNVKNFKPGDEVFGDVSECGWGAIAEYVCSDEKFLAKKPSNISFEQAAAVPVSAVTALQGLRFAGQIKQGQQVLINGASGGVGTFAIQIAKAYGAEVTAVCSTDKMEIARSLGADIIIDYTKENFTKNGKTYDLIFGINGYHPITEYKGALKVGGAYVEIGGTGAQIAQAMFFGPLFSLTGGKKICSMGMAKPYREDLVTLAELMEKGKVVPLIDKSFPLNEVPEAFRYFDKRHRKGKIVITV